MSRIEYYRVGTERRQREMWDESDIAEYCGISIEKADKLHMLANKECGVAGYGDINKEDFLYFLESVERLRESQRLQDEANASAILSAGKNFNLNLGSQLIYQALSLLKGLG